MPCRYRIDAERRVVVSTAWGNLTFADMDAHQEQLAVDPLFSPEFNQLVDATAVAGINLSLDEAKKVAGRRLFSSTSRRAFPRKRPIGCSCREIDAGLRPDCERTRTDQCFS
jgi:hypothetical protein